MGILVQENQLNSNMHNPPYTTGVIAAPDSHYIPQLYSHYQATKDYNKLNNDIYQSISKEKPADRKKTPVSVIVIGVAAFVFGLFKLAKHLIKK